MRIWINTNFDNALNPDNENPPLPEPPDVRRTPSDAEARNYWALAMCVPPSHDENRRRRSVSTNTNELMFAFCDGEGVKDPLFDIAYAPLSSVVCVRDPTDSDRAYFFCGNRYAVINVEPGTTDDTVSWGPKAIINIWPSLWVAGFSGGVGAILPNPKKSSEMYFFSGSRYALIDFAPGASHSHTIHTTSVNFIPFVLGTTNDYIINGPKKIEDNWPSLLKAAKLTHIDADVPNPANKDKAYFFSGSEYFFSQN